MQQIRFAPQHRRLKSTAKKAGARYITITTRHHDGYSLYDTQGLTDFDSVHTGPKRDLIREFVNECNAQGIVPFFYHTLLDWHNEDYKNDFRKYLQYLRKSVEILCSSYGRIGGLWFDGMWDKWDEDWQEDELYATIRKYQPTAMIINNTGLENRGRVGHKELDSVTFERGKPVGVDNSDRIRAGEMCQVLNDHWGYAENDYNYKPISEIITNLVDCRSCGCNFLLNVGPMPDGKIRPIDKEMLLFVGKWIKANKNFVYTAGLSDVTAEGATVLKGEKGEYYAVVSDVPMVGDPNVAKRTNPKTFRIYTDKKCYRNNRLKHWSVAGGYFLFSWS